MIHVVLAQAAREMERYLREMPDVYGDVVGDVLQVMGIMETLRARLESPSRIAALIRRRAVPLRTALRTEDGA
jgi:hypothetical protein